MDVIAIQHNSDFKGKFSKFGVPEFYKYLPEMFDKTEIQVRNYLSV